MYRLANSARAPSNDRRRTRVPCGMVPLGAVLIETYTSLGLLEYVILPVRSLRLETFGKSETEPLPFTPDRKLRRPSPCPRRLCTVVQLVLYGYNEAVSPVQAIVGAVKATISQSGHPKARRTQVATVLLSLVMCLLPCRKSKLDGLRRQVSESRVRRVL